MKTKIFASMLILTVFLAACGGGAYGAKTQAPVYSQSYGGGGGDTLPTNTSAPAPSANPNQVQISGFAFNPGTLTVKVGDTVTWTNMDSATHTVVADDGSFQSGQLATGSTFQFTFTKAGTFTYKCGIHASMLGTIIVQP